MKIDLNTTYSRFELTFDNGYGTVKEDIATFSNKLENEVIDDMKDVIKEAYHFENKGMGDVEFIKSLIEYYDVDIEDLIENLKED